MVPAKIESNGYRYYSKKDLEKLQLILFYRQLDFSLEEIKKLLVEKTTRVEILKTQRGLLLKKKGEIATMLETIDKSIENEEKRQQQEEKELFYGLEGTDPIGRTFQNFSIIFAKFWLVPFTGFCLFGVYSSIKWLLAGMPNYHWIVEFGKSAEIFYSILMLFVFLMGSYYGIRYLFFVKTKDILKLVNKPYMKKK